MSKPDLEPRAFLEKYADQAATFVITRAGRQVDCENSWTLLEGLHRLSADTEAMSITACVHHIPVSPDVDYVAITDANYMAILLELARCVKY